VSSVADAAAEVSRLAQVLLALLLDQVLEYCVA
jgi:hypothetical protein